ncbi:ABC transporter permease [Chloroflexota bacterium]
MNQDENSYREKRVTATKGWVRRFFRHENAILGFVAVALVVTFAIVTKGRSIQPQNIRNVFLQSAVRGVGAVGETFVVLTGGIDVSIGGISLFCSVLGASLMTNSAWQNLSPLGYPLPIGLGILVMLLTGMGWGFINGSAVSRIGMPSLIVTLAMWEITKGASFPITGGQVIAFLPEGLGFIGGVGGGIVPMPIVIFIIVVAVAYFVLKYTPYGRYCYATGGNPVSAYLAGINVKRIWLSVFMIAGFMAGLASVINTGRTMSASMLSVYGLELDAIASVFVGGVSLAGGKGSIIGVVLGVIIIGMINNALSIVGAGPTTQGIVKGVIIFGAVAVDYIRRR